VPDGDLPTDVARVAGYIRVSSAAQRDQGDSPASQRERLKQAGCTVFYEDLAVSGFRREQRRKAAAYDRLLADIAAGRVARLICTRLDRTGRRDDLVLALVEACDAVGVEFVSLASGTVSTATASDWLSVKVQTMLGEHFSRQLSESIRSGYQGLISAGIPARSSASLPIQLQRMAGTRHGVEPSPDWRACRRLIERFIAGKWTLAKSARFMHRTTRRLTTGKAVASWLRGQHLVGHMARRDGTVLIESCWPAICTASEKAQIDLRLGTRRRTWGINAKRATRSMSGLLRCYSCSRALAYSVTRRPSGDYAYIRCTDPSCPSKRAGIRADHLEQALLMQSIGDHLYLISEAAAESSNIKIPSAALLQCQQELRARESLPRQFRTPADVDRISELQRQIRRESLAPAQLDPEVVAMLDSQLRGVPVDSGWSSPCFLGQVDLPAGSPWGWFAGRSEQQRHHALSLLIQPRGVLVDTASKDRTRWIRQVRWVHCVQNDSGAPIETSGESSPSVQLNRDQANSLSRR
jgi:DNA invertase Pin-like site-specific DNA recombinase